MTAAYRLGMYGGAFDPPHLAHEALAKAAIEQYALDELRIVPTGQAWHKSRTLSAAQQRLAMAKLAFEALPQARVDPRETLLRGVSYTVDTLIELRAENPQAQLFLLMGQDQWEFFPHWHRYTDILQIATVLVAYRADSTRAVAQKDSKNDVKMLYQTINMSSSPISATQIRQLCLEFKSIDHLVKPSVAQYIDTQNLYRSL